MGKKRDNARWQDWLTLIPWAVVIGIVAFAATKAVWFDHITRDNKALFWASAATAIATFGLFVVAVIAAHVAFGQYKEYVRGERVKTTNDLLKEWATEEFQELLAFIDSCLPDWNYFPEHNREFARRLYRLVNKTKIEKRPNEDTKQWRKRKRRTLERRGRVSDGIETIAFLAARTWNLLHAGLLDEKVLFGQIDYYVVSSYFELEDVLAIRQVEDEQLYSEFTCLARAAQKHYRHRHNREVVDTFLDAKFEDLPFEDDEFEKYMNKVRARESEFWKVSEDDEGEQEDEHRP